MAMGNGPFEDVFPSGNEDIPLLCHYISLPSGISCLAPSAPLTFAIWVSQLWTGIFFWGKPEGPEVWIPKRPDSLVDLQSMQSKSIFKPWSSSQARRHKKKGGGWRVYRSRDPVISNATERVQLQHLGNVELPSLFLGGNFLAGF